MWGVRPHQAAQETLVGNGDEAANTCEQDDWHAVLRLIATKLLLTERVLHGFWSDFQVSHT